MAPATTSLTTTELEPGKLYTWNLVSGARWKTDLYKGPRGQFLSTLFVESDPFLYLGFLPTPTALARWLLILTCDPDPVLGYVFIYVDESFSPRSSYERQREQR